MAVACGSSFSAVVGEDGSLFSFGANEHGQLGTGDNPKMLSPSKVAELPAPVRQVAAGSRYTGIVTEAGDLLMCGCGEDGRLGLDDEEDQAKPKKVQDNVLMVACGYANTVTVTTSGDVYTFGYGENGQLGHGDTTNRFLPCLVPRSSFNNESVVMVAIGDDHTVALGQSGQVFTWGFGGYGILGHGSDDNEMKPKQVQSQCFKDEKVVFVAASGCQTSAVTVNGKLYTWGFGGQGQLGLGNTFTCKVPTKVTVDRSESGRDRRVVMVACGSFHSLVVTEDGALWACGLGNSGQLGLNSKMNRSFFELMDAGVFGNKKVVTAAAGHSHSAAVTEDGALWTWGRGTGGRLGHGNEEYQLQPKEMVGLSNMRIGRCRELPVEHALAFALVTHERLGENSSLSALTEDPLRMILNEAESWPKGLTKREQGLGRLLGGGLTPLDKWPEPEAGQETQPAISTMSRAFVKVCKPYRVSVSAQNL